MSAAPTILTRLRDRAVARRDPIRSDDVAVLYRRGHVAVTAEGAWAYYALGSHAWTGRPDDVNDQAVITRRSVSPRPPGAGSPSTGSTSSSPWTPTAMA